MKKSKCGNSYKRSRPEKNCSKGAILIICLWIISILSIFAMGIGFRASLEVRLSRYAMDKLRAGYMAQAGIVKAQNFLLNDTNEYDSLYECGITFTQGSAAPEESEEGGALEEESPGSTPEGAFSRENNTLEGGAFSVHYSARPGEGEETEVYYGVVDEERKININLDSFMKGLTKNEFKDILERIFEDIEEKERVIGAIIDWQDKDDGGDAEDIDYGDKYGYKCKDENFQAVEEMLLVKGMTKEIFAQIKDYLTVYSNGKINVNTASEKVLNAVISDGTSVYDELAEKIVVYRNGGDEMPGTSDDILFLDMDGLLGTLEEGALAERARLEALGDYFVFISDNFLIRSYGYVGKVTKRIECVVKRDASAGELEFLYYHEE